MDDEELCTYEIFRDLGLIYLALKCFVFLVIKVNFYVVVIAELYVFTRSVLYIKVNY